ncbi:LacI family DNA-binding transcriptional regulator [Sphingobacterium sp. Mn56C]|uniref:LacI family DNA-binding transcriptional regulator n=1 Tax=Sphingobacterium sp. Mn56C TaxID=3395261 RepID=UPI003BC11083
MRSKRPTTIKEIARKLKISASTVSRALNDHPSIGLVTTMRVKKMAEELNYEPNQTAIFFKQRKTFTIGVILPDLSEPFFSAAISAIEGYAEEKKYTVLLGQSQDDPKREAKIVHTFKKHRVDGILISLGKNTADLDFLKPLKGSGIPLVFFDCVPETSEVDKVYCDLSTGMEQAIEAFVSRGHKNIALINGPDTLLATAERTAFFKATLAKYSCVFNARYVVHTDLSEQGNIQAMEQLCMLAERPSAVVSFNDFVTLDVIKYARQKGIGVGQEMHFISFANYPLWKYMESPPLGSIEQYPGEQGEKAAEILFKLLEKPEEEPWVPQQVVLKSKLILK